MNKHQILLLAMGLGFISVIFFAGGSGNFEVLSRKMGNFLGFVFALASGFVWVIYGMKSSEK